MKNKVIKTGSPKPASETIKNIQVKPAGGREDQTGTAPTKLPPETVAKLREKAKAAEVKAPVIMEEIVLLPHRLLQLRLMMAYALLLLETADANAYVDELFVKLREKFKGKHTVPSRPAMYKYTAPLLEWIRQNRGLAEKINPTDLRNHPEYLTEIEDKDIEALAESCEKLSGLQRKYGSGKRANSGSNKVSKSTVPTHTSTEAVLPATKENANGKTQPSKATVAKISRQTSDPEPTATVSTAPTISALIDHLNTAYDIAAALIHTNVSLERATIPWKRCMDLFGNELLMAA